MKKLLRPLIIALSVLLAILVVRTELAFEDTQIQVTQPLDRVEVDTEAVSQRLSSAIQIPTISFDDPGKVDYDRFIAFHQLLRREFPQVHNYAKLTVINNYSLVYHFPGSDPARKPILLMGHMDVVPVDAETLDDWQHPPFGGDIADGFVWGRGAIDDKSTVMALMEAMELLLASGQKPQRSVYFSFGHDEEVSGPQGAAKIAEYFKQQNLHFEWSLDEGGVVTEGMMPGVEQPVAMIGVAEKGFVNIRLVAREKGGHSSMPPNHTAVGIVAQAIVKLEANQLPANTEYLDLTLDAIGNYTPYSLQLAMANRWLFAPLITRNILQSQTTAPSIRTTTAATMLAGSSKSNILPTKATAVVNFRILPGETVDSVMQHVAKVIDDDRISLEPFMARNPSPASATDSEAFRLLASVIREIDSNVLVAPYLVMGGTDSKYFYDLADDVYRFFMLAMTPELMRTAHGLNERLPIDGFITGIQYFHELLRRSAFIAPELTD